MCTAWGSRGNHLLRAGQGLGRVQAAARRGAREPCRLTPLPHFSPQSTRPSYIWGLGRQGFSRYTECWLVITSMLVVRLRPARSAAVPMCCARPAAVVTTAACSASSSESSSSSPAGPTAVSASREAAAHRRALAQYASSGGSLLPIDAEFRADLCSLMRRALGAEDAQLWRARWLLGASVALLVRRYGGVESAMVQRLQELERCAGAAVLGSGLLLTYYADTLAA